MVNVKRGVLASKNILTGANGTIKEGFVEIIVVIGRC